MGVACTHVGELRNVYKILVGKPEWKRPLGRPRRRGEGVKIDLRELQWEGVNWIHVAEVRDQWRAVVNTVMNKKLGISWLVE